MLFHVRMTVKLPTDMPAEQAARLKADEKELAQRLQRCLLYTSPSPRDLSTSRMPSSA